MTICNMSVEAGAKAGMVSPDDTTFAWLEGRAHAPKGADWEQALDDWRALATDAGAAFDKEVVFDAAAMVPHVSWGTNPSQVAPLDGAVPDPDAMADPIQAEAGRRALAYMGLTAGTPLRDVAVDAVFIGSCTNSRLEDLRAAATVVGGRHVAPGMRAMVVPGSMRVKAEAEAEGLDRVFVDAGFEWRAAGCSMCLGMNPDKLAPGERCASTSNRNFEGRQGPGGRTHLVSPAVAAATAIAGHLASPPTSDRRGSDDHGSRRHRHRHRRPPRPVRRRHRPDHAQRVAEAGGAHRLRRGPVLRLAARPRLRPQPPRARGRHHPGDGRQLRHRLVPGARGVGPARPRLQGGRVPRLRRHLPVNNCTKAGLLPVEVAPTWAGPCSTRCRPTPAWRSPSTWPPAPCRRPAAGIATTFPLDDFTQWRFLEGLDDIGITLRHEAAITAYEAARPARLPTTR